MSTESGGGDKISRRDFVKFGALTVSANMLFAAFPMLKDKMLSGNRPGDFFGDFTSGEQRDMLHHNVQEFFRNEYVRFMEEYEQKLNLEDTFLFVRNVVRTPPQIVIEICKAQKDENFLEKQPETIAEFVMNIEKGWTYEYERDLRDRLLKMEEIQRLRTEA